ncbi:hypothetical protein TRFO_29188 [Tritrichomonas foetus]|uniref:Uncharacterized protein n=1 Tax=Tritrichomonas foetus TaxID=1144522 RepID=A0A1J4K0W9_9EUKA|nr:hypothetical protein TRFO_29188 [Tritrichomonas foetus]|eukprot:OHT03388.1 hypothetical protein TRFO_29188 [Tritrichomonas foetus]
MSRKAKGIPLKVNTRMFQSNENFDVANTILTVEVSKRKKNTKSQRKILNSVRRNQSMERIFGKDVVDKMKANNDPKAKQSHVTRQRSNTSKCAPPPKLVTKEHIIVPPPPPPPPPPSMKPSKCPLSTDNTKVPLLRMNMSMNPSQRPLSFDGDDLASAISKLRKVNVPPIQELTENKENASNGLAIPHLNINTNNNSGSLSARPMAPMPIVGNDIAMALGRLRKVNSPAVNQASNKEEEKKDGMSVSEIFAKIRKEKANNDE